MEMAKLTPAQHEFLGAHIKDYVPHQWPAEIAGYAGSDRRFIRVRGVGTATAQSYVLVIWNRNDHDWPRFLSIQQDFTAHTGLLPAIFASDPQHGLILEEDLGADTLKAVLARTEAAEQAREWYRRVIEALIEWHGLDCGHSETIRSRQMDVEMFLWETDYFARHCVTEFFGNEKFLDAAWEQERQRLAQQTSGLPQVCMHRDFQSENVMIHRDSIRFIDYQGARLGPAEYDLASLLLDPYSTSLDSQQVYRLFEYYQERSGRPLTLHSFHQAAMQRLMQALGAFANLSIHKGKQWYRGFIPRALIRLNRICHQEPSFPAISRVVEGCLESAADLGA